MLFETVNAELYGKRTRERREKKRFRKCIYNDILKKRRKSKNHALDFVPFIVCSHNLHTRTGVNQSLSGTGR